MARRGLAGKNLRALGRYDGELQMYVDSPHEVDMPTLLFQRWLVEEGRAEHGIAGSPSGPLVSPPAEGEPSPAYTGRAA